MARYCEEILGDLLLKRKLDIFEVSNLFFSIMKEIFPQLNPFTLLCAGYDSKLATN